MIVFNKKCRHKYNVIQKSNALQLDHMGYPLRLFIVRCEKCGEYDQQWIDVPVEEYKEVKTGKSFLLEWKGVEHVLEK